MKELNVLFIGKKILTIEQRQKLLDKYDALILDQSNCNIMSELNSTVPSKIESRSQKIIDAIEERIANYNHTRLDLDNSFAINWYRPVPILGEAFGFKIEILTTEMLNSLP